MSRMQSRNKKKKKGGAILNHFFPSSSWELRDPWQIKWIRLKPWRKISRNVRKGIFFTDVAGVTILIPFYSTFRLYDRQRGSSEGEVILVLVNNRCVILDMSQRGKISVPQMLKCRVLASVLWGLIKCYWTEFNRISKRTYRFTCIILTRLRSSLFKEHI